MFVMWCGSNPALNYNGAFVLSRGRTLSGNEVFIASVEMIIYIDKVTVGLFVRPVFSLYLWT